MANNHTAFWLDLLHRNCALNQRSRLWNGYLGWQLSPQMKGEGAPKRGWPQLTVRPSDGSWPELTDEEKEELHESARAHGGHPEITDEHYMDFSDHAFPEGADFSGLVLVRSTFRNARFWGPVEFSEATRFYAQSWFNGVIFESTVFCDRTRFDAPVYFDDAYFTLAATFLGVEFLGGASFTGAKFKTSVMFNESRFQEHYFSNSASVPRLVDFRRAVFSADVSFRRVVFGNDGNTCYKIWPERRVDFSDAEFLASTDFREATFGGAPAFFNTRLHEDTDFDQVNWHMAETEHIPANYAIRAWERLELMMSKLEKPLDRHRFFRLKMRARRRTDGRFLRALNRLFEITSDYGWSVGRACGWWLGHWVVASLVLLANTRPADTVVRWLELCMAALGTGFANAHAFLRLTATGGYLEQSRVLLENSEVWTVVTTVVGVIEAVCGPVMLFLLLLTLRNRFRLA